MSAAGVFSPVSVILLYAFMGITNVINANTMLIKPIEDISFHDKLTGCYNRAKLGTKIPEYDNYISYALIFFDINNLKKVNDTHGHDEGDRLIIDASNQLRFWHEYGDLFRIGGDEFIVVVPNAQDIKLEEILTNWYDGLPALNARYDDEFVCHFSYGVYYKKDQMSFETVMSHADEKMYEMKKKTK